MTSGRDAPDEGRAEAGGPSERTLSAGLLALFLAIALLAGADVASDLAAGTTVAHVLLEGAVALTSLVGVVLMTRRVRAMSQSARLLRAETEALQADLARSQKDAERWRGEARDLIQGLSAAIDRQLGAWALSPAEKEIALLLLKGLSHKEIAELRNVSEATVRQQSRALYKKAGLGGRADLAAFFLEDLLGPR
jgi:DNA-binding CsgD family transcriptional regulator